MTTYTYSITSDFGGSINQSQFYDEIIAATGINPTFEFVLVYGDVVEIKSDSSLSGPEQTTLNNLVSNHVPNTTKPKKKFFPIFPYLTQTASSTYTKMGIFRWGGSTHVGGLDYIDVLSYMDSGATSYDIKVEDSTNGNALIAQANFTNTTINICDLGTISNVPAEPAILILYGRVNGGNNMYAESINVYHNN